jgi:hypothetical protein
MSDSSTRRIARLLSADPAATHIRWLQEEVAEYAGATVTAEHVDALYDLAGLCLYGLSLFSDEAIDAGLIQFKLAQTSRGRELGVTARLADHLTLLAKGMTAGPEAKKALLRKGEQYLRADLASMDQEDEDAIEESLRSQERQDRSGEWTDSSAGSPQPKGRH